MSSQQSFPVKRSTPRSSSPVFDDFGNSKSAAQRDPCVVLADQLHARAHALGPHDTSIAMNLALEKLSEGSDSPLQVGVGPIDELAAYDYSVVHKSCHSLALAHEPSRVTATSPRV